MSNILKYFCIIASLGGAIALICKAIHSQDILCLILGVLLISCCCIITKCPTDDEDIVLRPMSSMTQEEKKQNELTMLVNKENQDVFLVVPSVVEGERYFIIRQCDFPSEYHIGDVYLSKEKWLRKTIGETLLSCLTTE